MCTFVIFNLFKSLVITEWVQILENINKTILQTFSCNPKISKFSLLSPYSLVLPKLLIFPQSESLEFWLKLVTEKSSRVVSVTLLVIGSVSPPIIFEFSAGLLSRWISKFSNVSFTNFGIEVGMGTVSNSWSLHISNTFLYLFLAELWHGVVELVGLVGVVVVVLVGSLVDLVGRLCRCWFLVILLVDGAAVGL